MNVEQNQDYIDNDYKCWNDIKVYCNTIVFVNGRQWLFNSSKKV
jgi:hypothetical protein